MLFTPEVVRILDNQEMGRYESFYARRAFDEMGSSEAARDHVKKDQEAARRYYQAARKQMGIDT